MLVGNVAVLAKVAVILSGSVVVSSFVPVKIAIPTCMYRMFFGCKSFKNTICDSSCCSCSKVRNPNPHLINSHVLKNSYIEDHGSVIIS